MARKMRKIRRGRTSISIKKWGLIVGGAGVLALVVLFFVFNYMIRAYLNSDEFKEKLERQAAKGTRCEEFKIDGVSWSGSGVDSSGVRMLGGLVTRLNVEQVKTEVNTGALWNRELDVTKAEVDALVIDLSIPALLEGLRQGGSPDGTGAGDEPNNADNADNDDNVNGGGKRESSWLERNVLPNSYTLRELLVRRLALRVDTGGGKMYELVGGRVHLTPDIAKMQYKAKLEGGELVLPLALFGRSAVDSAEFGYQNKELSIKKLRMRLGAGGFVEADVVYRMEDSTWHGNMVLQGGDVVNAVPEDWKQKCEGKMEVTVRVGGIGGDVKTAEGSFSVRDAKVKTLPVLDTLALFAATERFRMANLDICEAKFRLNGDVWSIYDIVMTSPGLMRIEGGIEFSNDSERRLRGQIRLGIPAGLLAWLPMEETGVFTKGTSSGSRGAKDMDLLWVNINLSGTLDDPKEDLTARIMSVAGERIAAALRKVADTVIEQGRGLLDNAPSVIKSVTDVIDGGRGKKEDKSREDAKEDGEGTPPTTPPEGGHKRAEDVINAAGRILGF